MIGRLRIRDTGRALMATVAVLALATPLAARAAEHDEPRPPAEQNMVDATQRTFGRFVELWNGDKIDQLVSEVYGEHPILIPPNHEAIYGRAETAEYLKGARAASGEIDEESVVFAINSSEKTVSLAGRYDFRAGLRVNSHQLYQRQTDGTARLVVDMFGSR